MGRGRREFLEAEDRSDGVLVLFRLFMVIKSYKPLTFFGLGSIGFMVALGLAVGFRPVL